MPTPLLQRNSTTGRLQEVTIADPPTIFPIGQSTGSTIATNKAIAYSTANNIRLADSGVTNDYPVIGFTTAAITSGGSGYIQTDGILSGFTGLTSGGLYFSDPSTPGGITTTVPTTAGQKSQIVGRAISTTAMWIEIEEPITLAQSAGASLVSNIVGLNQIARILDDNNVRASSYAANVQCSGVAGLPSTGMKGVFLKITFLVTAVGAFTAVIENPDYIFGATSIAGYCGVAGQSITGLAFTNLSSTGAFRVALGAAGGANRIVYDVTSYTV